MKNDLKVIICFQNLNRMERSLFLVFFMGTVISAKFTLGTDGCRPPCFCNIEKKSASCNSRRLRYIPLLPSYIERVKFVQNSFTVINRNFFKNLTLKNHQIKVLNLTDNLIQHISEDAFTDFRYLLSLDISKEPRLNTSALKESFYSLRNSSLLYLQLSKNGWKEVPKDLFKPFATSKRPSFNVSLARNKIQSFDDKVFSDLKNLKYLNLAKNSIRNIDLEGMVTIHELNLNGNFIRDIPKMCDANNKTLVPNLRILRMDDNSIAEMNQTSFKCIEKLEKLNLDANNFRTLKSNTFSELRNLKILYMSRNARLQKIEDTAFNVSSLQSLYFRQNHFQFNKNVNKKYRPKTLFKYCPDLTTLDMSENYIPTVNQYQIFKEIFWPLTKLRNLTLCSTSMRAIPRDVFPRLKQLEFLDLKGNFLQGWEQSTRVFGENSSLKMLNLHSNIIQFVNETTFPPSLLLSLDTLDLSDNFFSCTCDLMWFRNWIRETIESRTSESNLTLIGYPAYYKCKLPGGIRGSLVEQYNPTLESCKEMDPLIVIAISVGSFGAFAIIIILITYKCQTNIKNYIYLCRFYKNKKTGYIRLDSDADYEYHAFIVYCESDREWVHNTCVKRLEQEGLKVCIHHRDFDIGEPVTGNIEKYMSKCHKIVVIMSNNFAVSEWCQWEVDLVHERRRRHGKNVSLLVMLRNIDSKHMTNRLRALIDTTPYLTYCTGVGENVFWDALLKGLRKPFGHPPIALV